MGEESYFTFALPVHHSAFIIHRSRGGRRMRGKYNSVRGVEARNAHSKSSERKTEQRLNDERGMTLVAVMLIMSLMLMLGLAVTFTSVSDKAITSNFKNLTSGFYAAEAGINNLHRLIRDDHFVLASLPSPPRVTPGQPTLNPGDFITAAEQALNKTEHFPNQAAYRTKVKIKDIQVP